ncbi:MAG: F0F1 ATP synthase subunit A [Acidimicrobiales bacterium]
MFAALEFPPIENLVEWPAYLFQDTPFAFNKVALISVLAMLIPAVLFALAKKDLVPRGLQNLVESTIEFVENQVIMAAIGPDGMRYLPLLLSIFLFVFFGNIFEVIPTFQMPANARMANPMFLAIIVWFTFVGVGIRHHGAGFFKDALFPPGVPTALYVLVTPIEFIATFILRPFGLAVRLFANMLAGHILLVTFGVLCITLWQKSLLAVVLPFSFSMLVALTGFEVMVSFLQAFVFSLLAAVYIDLSLHPHH